MTIVCSTTLIKDQVIKPYLCSIGYKFINGEPTKLIYRWAIANIVHLDVEA